MTDNITYFKAILPLRLEWEPCYYTDNSSAPEVGDRVRVPLAGKEYVAVVSETGITPDVALERVQPMISAELSLERISAEELRFWRFLSDYYLCTSGEVYKAAYPASRIATEEKKSRRRRTGDSGQDTSRRRALSADSKELVRRMLDLAEDGKPIVLQSAVRLPLYAELTARILDSNRTVLVLCPGKDDADATAAALDPYFPGKVSTYHSSVTQAARRDLASAVRKGGPMVVVGTKQALFLPFSSLGMVVVDEEQDPLYKQESPAPRFHGRDAAAILSGIHGAQLILGCTIPSLETGYNIESGKFQAVSAGIREVLDAVVVDTVAESRKNGMEGDFSRVVLKQAENVSAGKGRVLFITPWKDHSDQEISLREGHPGIRAKFVSVIESRRVNVSSFAMVVVLGADYLGGKDDFRADEKALQTLLRLKRNCAPGTLYIQTRNTSSPVFGDILSIMAERRQFLFPPFTRLVDVRFEDANAKRSDFMSSLLHGRLVQFTSGWKDVRVERHEGRIRIFLPKNKLLSEHKQAIRHTVATFGEERKYSAHLVMDVDPN